MGGGAFSKTYQSLINYTYFMPAVIHINISKISISAWKLRGGGAGGKQGHTD